MKSSREQKAAQEKAFIEAAPSEQPRESKKAPPPEKPKLVGSTIQFPADLHERLKDVAHYKKIPLRAIVIEACQQWLDRGAYDGATNRERRW